MAKQFEIGIIGAGLAGLVTAIHLAKSNRSVVLFEKSTFPRHKVCGEYISMEVYDYLVSLGVNVFDLGAVKINRFQFTTENGKMAENKLEMGGFGLSRYTLDYTLWEKAKSLGVTCLVDEVIEVTKENRYVIRTKSKCNYTCNIVVGAQGKRSKLDRNLGREFIKTRTPWIGVKAHYQFEMPKELVALHHFEGGYCGLSNVEGQRVNACYLVHQSIFEKCGSIEKLQNIVLSKNPRLKDFFSESKCLFDKPISISQIYFGKRKKEQEGILFAGDAAGMIHPLAGNGMAMAIHSGKLVSDLIVENGDGFLDVELKSKYEHKWNQQFKNRVLNGNILHKLLENRRLSNFMMNIVPLIPGVLSPIIKQTHGKKISPFE